MLAWIVQLGYKAGAAAPSPPPVVTTPTPAGRSRQRQRYYVEIDGQQFIVSSVAEATQLLQQARAIAERQSEDQGERATKLLKRKPKIPRVELDQPEIKVSPEISTDLAPLIEDIKRLYSKAAEMAELRLLMLKAERTQRAEDDDEDDLLLLL